MLLENILGGEMYLASEVKSVIKVASTTKVYRLSYRGLPPSPGQFFMVWIPRAGEIPLSAANYRDGELVLAITKRGKITSYIYDRVQAGDRVYLRGPYGRGFNPPCENERSLLVGGGSGLAPLLFLTEKIRDRGGRCDALLGFESKGKAFFLEEFEALCDKLFITTEDGSIGFKGIIPDALKQILQEQNYDVIYLCGPEPMMARIINSVQRIGLRLEASLERYMRCGVGVCGTCILDPLGLRVCRDGPVFPLEVLLKIEGLGRWWRSFDSRKIPI